MSRCHPFAVRRSGCAREEDSAATPRMTPRMLSRIRRWSRPRSSFHAGGSIPSGKDLAHAETVGHHGRVEPGPDRILLVDLGIREAHEVLLHVLAAVR